MNFRRVFASLALIAATSASGAATTIADRSPFTQGLWWNAQRSGHGFEIFNAGTETMVLWYTFDRTGAPIWYSAQGTFGTASWPLRKHRWADGRLAATEIVGTLGVAFTTPESAQVSVTLDGVSGMLAIEPFRLSGIGSDVDRTGTYFDPAASGWGLSLLHQGDVLGGILYTYDASGAPTWYAGFDRTSTERVNFYASRGSCATCPYSATASKLAGTLTFTSRGETALTLGNGLNATFARGASPDGAPMVQLGRAASTRPADRNLANFTDDAALKSFLDAAMMATGVAQAASDFSPAPPAPSFSTTNLQEAGVDEADLVKSDGARIYTFASDIYGNRRARMRVARVAGDGAQLEVEGEVPLKAGMERNLLNAGLYVAGQSLVAVVGPGLTGYCSPACESMSGVWNNGNTSVEIFDTSGPGMPASVWHAKIDGYLVASRRIGNRLYVIARHTPTLSGFTPGANAHEPTRLANLAVLARTPLPAMLPSIRVDEGAPTPILGPESVFVPPQGTRPVGADMILVYAIDIPQRKLAQALAVLGTPDAVYASPSNLFVATSRYQYRTTNGALLPPGVFAMTEVHQFRLGNEGMSVVGSGTVEGQLATHPDKAAFRMGEKNGRLRIVTSDSTMWGGAVKNRLTILESVAGTGFLKTVSHLPNAARPESLGKPGELLYGTRFVDDRLYAVTFKNIDPLYVIDLANAADPKITGALEIPGFSEYLHPLPNGLLLGFGKDAKPAADMGDGTFAWYQGLQLTLFDVSGSGVPREMQRITIGKRGSESALMTQHRAFSALRQPDGSLAIAFPARIHDGATYPNIGDAVTYPWVESALMRYELRGSTPADARIVAQQSLVFSRATAPGGSSYAWTDSAAVSGRSVLFQKGAVYIDHGRFWRQNAAGEVAGPF